jgi:hypothetical protein
MSQIQLINDELITEFSEKQKLERLEREYSQTIKRKHRILVWEGIGLRWINEPVKVNFT